MSVINNKIYNDGINEAIGSLGLLLSDIPHPQLSTRSIAESSREKMWGLLMQLKSFLISIGNWEDCLILHDKKIDNAPSVSLESIQMFLDFKDNEKKVKTL